MTYILTTITWCGRSFGKKNAVVSESNNIKKFAIGENFEEFTERLSGKAYEEMPARGFVREHLFGIGNYTNSWNFGPSGFVHDYLFPRKWLVLKERIGVSMFLINRNFTKYCVLNLFNYSWHMAWGIMMLSANSKIIEEAFDREQLSLISEEKANIYFDAYIALFEKKEIEGNKWICNKVLNVLPIVLGRLCTKVDQNRVLRFVKAALKWEPRFVNKVLRYVYDCLDNKNLSVIWTLLLTEKNIATNYNRNGFELPDRYMLNYNITDSIIKRIIDGLKSDSKDEVLQAISFMEVIWDRDDLSYEDRDNISSAVRFMRNREDTIPESIYTYNYVDLSDNERGAFQTKLDNDVKSFCENNYEYNHTSVSFGQWYSLLEKFDALSKYITEDVKKKVLIHCYDNIEMNKLTFDKNDVQELFGGIRRFTQQIVNMYQRLILDVAFENWTADEIAKIENQIDWLMGKEYRCLPMKVKIYMNGQHIACNDIGEFIKTSLFNKNSEVQDEGINAFFVLYDNGGNVREILTYIFENYGLADVSIYKKLLILFMNLIVRNYNENDFNRRVIDLLNKIHHDYKNYGMDAVALSDMQHYANYVAGALSVKIPDEKVPVFDKNISGFNDVCIGYDMGVESAFHGNR